MSNAVEPALVAVRLVAFVSGMVLLGSPVFVLGLAARFGPEAAPRRDFAHWLGRVLPLAAAAALGAAALWLDLVAAIMGGGWGQAIDPHTIALVLSDTAFGRAWAWHLGFGVALLGLVLVAPPRAGPATALAALLAALFLASTAWAGHAVMHPGLRPLAVQVVHLLAGGLWLGSLPALFHLLARARASGAADWHAAAIDMLPRYSGAGYGAVALVLLTGMMNSAALVGGMGALATTPYGRVLLVKIALVLLMVGVAAWNRVRLVPRIGALEPGGDGVAAVRALGRSVALEQALGVLVLAAVSLLGTLPPALVH
ncbi:MAG TPA: copper homeostasis membrane protein CopD [Stellaceae bacterium]|nr:copper homeostasis membrane protein CopD [Stellaceae bacterium]